MKLISVACLTLAAVLPIGTGAAFAGDCVKKAAVATSATGILAQLDGLSPQHSGEFLDYSGKRWPW